MRKKYLLDLFLLPLIIRQEHEDAFAVNPMELHYDNPALNAFDDGFAEGINPEEMKKTCSLLLRTPVITITFSVVIKQFYLI